MNIRPLTQLRELITAALRSQANLGKSFQSFFIETMELFLTHTGRLNFTQMARCGRSCESRFRQNVFVKPNEQRELVHSVVARKRRPKVNFKKAFD